MLLVNAEREINMEHIVQFAISIDDNAIVASVTKNAEKEIIKDLKQQVINKIFSSSSYYRNDADPEIDKLSSASEDIIKKAFEENQQYILDKAAELLADRLARSKKGKELLTKLFEEA